MTNDPKRRAPGTGRAADRSDDRHHRRRRRWSIVLAVIALLILAGLFAIRQFVRPDRLTALLVSEVQTHLGAQLELGDNARFGFWPGLRVELPQAVLRGTSGAAPILSATSIDVAMRWRSLWADTLEVERVELDRPQLDLDALNAWLKTLPESTGDQDFHVNLSARDGRLLRGGVAFADGIDVDVSGGNALSAWLAQFDTKDSAAPATLVPPLVGSMTVKEIRIGDTQLKGVRIEFNDAAKPAAPDTPR